MGYYISNGIKFYHPDNDENTLYVGTIFGENLGYLIERISDHFNIERPVLENFTIEAEHIHTACIGYDKYDSGDYTDFIVIRKIK